MNKYFIILIIMMVFLVFCTTSTVERTEEHSGTTVKLKKDQHLDVILTANPTTGYQWKIVEMDTTILIHMGTEYLPDEVPEGILGAGGKSIFHFKSDNIGETTLKIIYYRDFEENIPPVRTFELTVIVQS